MKYDDAAWHYGGEFPDDLPDAAGGTHIGMFLAWALLAGLGGEVHTGDDGALAQLRGRALTPGAFLMSACDGKFTDADLSDTGNAFAQAYFDLDDGDYLFDYEDTLDDGLSEDANSLYYIADSWENFDRLRPVLDQRFAQWRAAAG